MTGWDDVAATALLGTARRSLPVEPLPAELRRLAGEGSSDPSARLLDVAALGTVYRRAGMRLQPPRDRPAPAAADDRPIVPAAARARLTELLASADGDLLGQWLRVATARGLAPPPAALPALLARAGSRETAPDVIAAVGTRGAWLAGFEPQWRNWVGPATGLVPVPETRWALAGRAERRQWLIDLRAQTAFSARSLVGSGWSDRSGVVAPELIATLRQAVSGQDETFLEECLDDGRGDVRRAAAGLLGLLPGSAFMARALARARAVVRVEGSVQPQIVVNPPTEFDDEMIRDQIPGPGPDVDLGSWLVTQIVRSVPLRTWPQDAADLPVEERWAGTLWHAWLEVTAGERDPAWAGRLIPHEPRGRAAFIARMLSAIPAPWPRDLSLITLGWLQARGEYPHDIRKVLELAARRLPVEAAARMDAIGRRWPPESQTRYAFARATQVMLYRRAMFEELQ